MSKAINLMYKVIWNDDRTMCFLAHKFLAARISYPHHPEDKGEHWVRIHLKGTILEHMTPYTGIAYACCKNEEEAKECLARLIAKLVLAEVIKEPTSESSNRFNHVDLQEVTS